MRPIWKRFRHRLEAAGLRLLAWLVPRLPRRACVALARGLGWIYWKLDRRGRTVALANLQAAFGEKYSPAERTRIARASFQNFARALLDLFWAQRLNRRNYSRWLRLENFDENLHAIKAAHGAIIPIVTHFGGYEWVSLSGGFVGLESWVVTQEFKNSRLDAIFAHLRGHSGMRPVGREQSMLKMLRALKKKDGGAGLLVDLTLRPTMPSAALSVFGGLKICATIMHAVLHARTGVPLTPLTGEPLPDGTCVVTAHPPLTFPPTATHAEIAQAVWDFFETFIQRRPDLWLWSYKHFRYRPGDAAPEMARRYPFYSQVSPAFDRLIAEQAAASAAR
ncbi:MAG: hypothetical protein JO295_04000 [Verrucomicrobia bacterium]|nr:hypothetical protein [Verrucomicrobiota bacterium]